MNLNPYPRGRWTSPTSATSRLGARPASRRTSSEPPTELLNAPLRELFWGLPESTLLEEAKVRIDQWVNAALSREPVPAIEAVVEVIPVEPMVA